MVLGTGFHACPRCRITGWDDTPVAPAVSAGPLADLLDRLPHVIALPVNEYLRASGHYLKLHRLTNAAEFLTSFCAAIALANLLVRGGAKAFPKAVRKHTLNYLGSPAFGNPEQILDAHIKAISEGYFVVPELYELVKGRGMGGCAR